MILNTTKPAKLGSKNGNAVFQLANREFFIFYKPSDKNTGTGSRLPPSNYLLGQIDFLFALSLHILQRLLRGDSAGGRSAQMLTNDVLQLCILGDNRRSHKVIKALKDRLAICRRSLFFVLSDDILVLNRRQLPACVQANLRCFTVGGNVGDELNGFISNLRIFGNDVTVGEEVRSLLSVTRFNNDIPIEVAIARIFGEWTMALPAKALMK